MPEDLSSSQNDSSQESGAKNLSELAGKYLTFHLAGEEYGIQITKIREIVGIMEITPVPQTTDFVLGVVNLRGKVIPVLDLRLRFGMEYREPDDRTSILVVEVVNQNGQRVLTGIQVDQVNEVITVNSEELEDNATASMDVSSSNILGLATQGDRVRILLDVDRVVQGSSLVAA